MSNSNSTPSLISTLIALEEEEEIADRLNYNSTLVMCLRATKQVNVLLDKCDGFTNDDLINPLRMLKAGANKLVEKTVKSAETVSYRHEINTIYVQQIIEI
jgi:hypothetical protein